MAGLRTRLESTYRVGVPLPERPRPRTAGSHSRGDGFDDTQRVPGGPARADVTTPSGSGSAVGQCDASVFDPAPWSGGTSGYSTSTGDWWTLFTEAQRPRRNRRRSLDFGRGAVVVITAAAIAVTAAVTWLLPETNVFDQRNDGPSAPPGSHVASSDGAFSQLSQLLPSGYTRANCTAATVPENALAKAVCGQNSDSGGPASATFTMVRDDTALTAAFGEAVRHLDIVNCPGEIQSPGPWHSNAAPQKSSGTVVCGFQGGVPTTAWTTDGARLFSAVQGSRTGSTLDGLFRWWSSQS
jgi:hypothetical protein